MSKEFENFKKKSLHEYDSILPILIIDPITTRINYLIKKKKIKITPNQISNARIFILSPLILISMFLAPIFNLAWMYLVTAGLFYLSLLTDGWDGQLARALDMKSKKGFFLDLIGDRCSIIIFLFLIFSVGMFTHNNILVYSSVFLFTIKTFHMMIITKVYYLGGIKTEKETLSVFTEVDTLGKMGVNQIYSIIAKLNKILKIKRWDGTIAAPDRYIMTIMVPCILLFFRNNVINTVIIWYFYILILFFTIFFMIRIKNLLKESFIKFSLEDKKNKN